MCDFRCRICRDNLLWTDEDRLVHASTGKMTRNWEGKDHVALPEKKGCFDTQEVDER